jgi:mRNA interferase MazF
VVTYQWGIFWADLDPTKGSEQSGTRPVLVISVEAVNKALPIVTVMSITSVKPGRKVYPTEVYLSATETGLSKDSIAMSHQIRAVSKSRLGNKCGSLDNEEIRTKIRAVVKIYLELE